MSGPEESWADITLGDECVIERGISWSREQETNASDDAWPVVTIPNIREQLDLSTVTHITGVSEKAARKATASVGHTILIGSNGNKERVGDCCYIGKPMRILFASFLMGIAPKKGSRLNARYLYYLLKSSVFRNRIHGSLVGTTSLSNLRLSYLREQVFRVASLDTQRKIAAILSAYDDLIENNTRRIKILEEMAEATYREWFVHFRFPGHKKVKMVDSPMGKIPERWEVVALLQLADINARSIKRGDEPDEILYIDISSVSTASINKVETMAFADAPGRARRLVRHGDIIWSTVRPNRKSYALILHPGPHLIVSTGFAVISATIAPHSYLYLGLTTDDFAAYLTNHAKGAAYPAVSAEDFEKAKVLHPPAPILTAFQEAVEPMLEQIHRLAKKNEKLRQTRDLLLPKLISGEVDVSNLDINVGEDLR